MKSITPEDRFWRQLGTARPFSTVEASLFICSLSEVDVDPLFALLRRRGIQRVDQNDAPIWLVIVDSMGDPNLAYYNEKACALEIPLLILKPAGIEIEYALFKKPTACWACFEKRHRLLDGSATYLHAVLNLQHPVTEPPSYTDTTTMLAFHLAVLELEFLLSKVETSLQGMLRSVHIDKMQSSDHLITRLPDCPICGHTPNEATTLPAPPAFNQLQSII